MNLAKREGKKGQLGLENILSAVEWLSQHPAIRSENRKVSPFLTYSFVGRILLQPTLVIYNSKKCGEWGQRRKSE